jgi:hypothetical protein
VAVHPAASHRFDRREATEAEPRLRSPGLESRPTEPTERRLNGRLGIWVAAAAWLAVTAPAAAVELNATIKGVVSDTDGLPLPRATLVLRSPNLQGDRTTETDDDGRYRLTPLPPGDYELEVGYRGFRTWMSPSMQLQVGTTLSVNPILLPEGDADYTIDVIAAAPTVDIENTSTGVVLDAEFLKHVPTGRDYQSAMSVAPGVVGGGNANMHGGFQTSNQFYMDGVNITDPVTNTFSTNLNYDTIDQLQVITGGMDAEYGRALGGAINILTKSGGNEFEGSVNLLYSNQDFILAPELAGDSRDDFLEEQLALGGPIVKDKLWFFTSLQGDRYVDTVSVDTDEVPRDTKRFPMQPRDWGSMYLFGKLTAQPNPAHRIWVNASADPTWIRNAEQSVYTLPSGETIQRQGGWVGSIGHVLTPSEDVIVESQLHYQKSVINFFSALWKDCRNFDASGVFPNDFSDLRGVMAHASACAPLGHLVQQRRGRSRCLAGEG